MVRRILIVGSIGIALTLGGRYALGVLAERALETRRGELAAQALPNDGARRPWEARFEALTERLRTSPRFTELVTSAHRPQVAWGGGEARPLDEFETLWVEAIWSELAGFGSTLDALRSLPPSELAWHGETAHLHLLRECTNAVCARAWLAAQRGEHAEAAQVYGDALRLCTATDDGTSMGLLVREACTATVLASMRSALDLGLAPGELRGAVAPLLSSWDLGTEAAERIVRRDLTLLATAPASDDGPCPVACATSLEQLAPLEQALAIARLPATASPWAGDADARDEDATLATWTAGVRGLHRLHARRNLALSALAVATFRAERGSWPAALAELAELDADARTDPWTGEPLAYACGETGAVLGPCRGDLPAERWTLSAAYFP